MKDMLATTVERILSDLSPPAAVRAAEAGTWPTALWQQIEEAGLPLALVPEDLGGVGLGWRDIAPVLRACGRHAAPVPLPEVIAAHALAALAGQALPAGIPTLALLERTAAGRIVARDVPFARNADFVVSTLRVGSRVELVVLNRATAELTPGASPLAGDGRCHLEWRDAVPLLCAPIDDAPSILELGAALRTAQLAGASSRVLEMSVRYAEERKQFGQAIAKFQAIQQQLAVLAEIDAACAMAAELACASADGRLCSRQVACAKSRASEAAGTIAAIAHAVHGAIGITAEHDLQLYTRRLWAWRLDFGSDAYWNTLLGQQLLTSDSGIWPEVVEVSTVA